MTSAKDISEIKRTKDMHSKAQDLYKTKKAINKKVMEARGRMFFDKPIRVTPLTQIVEPVAIRQSLAFDNTYLSLCLFGGGFFAGVIVTLMRA